MNRLLVTLVFASLATIALAQSSAGFRIEGQIRGLRDTTITLAHYFGHNQYIPKDTARIDRDGRFVFEGNKRLPGGLYIAIPPTKKQQYIELVLGTPYFSFETDTVNLTASMRITGSPDNEAFYAYQKQLLTLTEERNALDIQIRFRPDKVARLIGLQNRVVQVQQKYAAPTDSMLVAKLLRASLDPLVPAAPRLKTGRPDSLFQFAYFKNHFWDGFDFSDERLVRSPIFQRKIDRYLQDLTAPTVDSLARSADLIVNRARANKEMLSYAIWYITSQYERPRMMGTEGLFVHMAETYYLSGVMPSTTPATVDNIRKRVEIVKPLLVGKTFPALSVSDTLRQPVQLETRNADYTVVFFYDPTCAHCRESMPALKQFSADVAKSKGVQFCAIAVDNSPDAWQKFIREYGIQPWVNGYDYSFQTDYRKRYDVLKTPTVYVLDKDRQILARALPPEQIGDFIQFHRQQTRQLAVRK